MAGTTADKLQGLIDGKQYIINKINAKANTSLVIDSKWADIGDAVDNISSGGGSNTEILTKLIGVISEPFDFVDNSLEALRDYAFAYHPYLKSATLNVTVLGANAFYYCTVLETVNLPNVEELSGSCFYGCSSLITLNIPNLKVLGISSLSNTAIVSFSNENITTVPKNAFKGCKDLIRVDLSNAISIDANAFETCENLQTINIPNVSSVGQYCFRNCYIIETINIPTLTAITNYAFYGCKQLQTAYFKVANTIGKNAFQTCTNLTDIYLGYDGVVALENTSAFSAAGTTQGYVNVHVKPDYADSYATATNWSSVITNGQITIVGDYSD